MNWEAIAAIGEILGAVFVFLSLVYLGLQIRQSSKNILSQSINSQANQIQNLAALQANPEMMKAMKKIYVDGDSKPDFESAALLEAYYISGLAIAQSQYRHHIQGLDSDWETSRRMVLSYFGPDFVKNWWHKQARTVFDDAFVAEVNHIIEQEHQGDYWTTFAEGDT